MTKLWMVLLMLVSCALPVMAQELSIYCEESQPLQYTQDGKLVGFSAELVREIQRRIGSHETIQVVPWARGLYELDHSPNTLLFSVARTAERNPKYRWIGPITERTYAFYARANDNIKINSLDDARKVPSIGVYRNDVRDQTLTKLGFTNLDRADNNVVNLRKLMLGRLTLFAGSVPQTESQTRAAGFSPSEIKPIFVFLRSQLYVAASLSTDPAVVARWNKALDDMKKDQSFQKLHRHHFPELEVPETEMTPM